MRLKPGLALSVALSLAIASGCTTMELRKDTIGQMGTVHDLQQQQVLDNLAMFVCNRNSYPYYSTIGPGACTVADQGSLAITNGSAQRHGVLIQHLGDQPHRFADPDGELAGQSDQRLRKAHRNALPLPEGGRLLLQRAGVVLLPELRRSTTPSTVRCCPRWSHSFTLPLLT